MYYYYWFLILLYIKYLNELGKSLEMWKIIKSIRLVKQAYKASIDTIFKALIILVENKF